MKNERFERYIYMGVTAILVLIAAVFVVFLFLERNAVFAFLGKVRFVLAPVIYGAVLAFLMSPVYNRCYNTVVYVHDDDKKKEDEEKKIAPKKRFKSESFGNFLGKAIGTVISLAFLIVVCRLSVSGEECSVCLSGKSTVCPGTGDLRRCTCFFNVSGL